MLAWKVRTRLSPFPFIHGQWNHGVRGWGEVEIAQNRTALAPPGDGGAPLAPEPTPTTPVTAAQGGRNIG
jgi:hypothetical protein